MWSLEPAPLMADLHSELDKLASLLTDHPQSSPTVTTSSAPSQDFCQLGGACDQSHLLATIQNLEAELRARNTQLKQLEASNLRLRQQVELTEARVKYLTKRMRALEGQERSRPLTARPYLHNDFSTFDENALPFHNTSRRVRSRSYGDDWQAPPPMQSMPSPLSWSAAAANSFPAALVTAPADELLATSSVSLPWSHRRSNSATRVREAMAAVGFLANSDSPSGGETRRKVSDRKNVAQAIAKERTRMRESRSAVTDIWTHSPAPQPSLKSAAPQASNGFDAKVAALRDFVRDNKRSSTSRSLKTIA